METKFLASIYGHSFIKNEIAHPFDLLFILNLV